jgi:hypothetical protein
MNFEDFMEDPYQEEIGGKSQAVIARAIVQPAFQGWQFGSDPQLFPYEDKKSGLDARAECAEYCQGENSYPQPGMLTVIYGDDVPSHPEGAMSGDWHDFVPVFHSREKYTGQVDVVGEYPYDLVLEGVKKNQTVFNQVQWCQFTRPIDNVREPRRNKETNKYVCRIYVVGKVFKSREEAYREAGVSEKDYQTVNDNLSQYVAGVSEKNYQTADDNLSQYATEKGWTLQSLQKQGPVIHNAIDNALKGIGTPDNKPMEKEAAIALVCANFILKPEDLELLADIPF